MAEYARHWAATRPHGPRTARRVDSLIRVHIEGTPLGARRVAEVLPSEVQGWVTGRSKVLAPLTVQNLVTMLRSIFTAAVRDRVRPSSPCVDLSLPSTAPEELVPLTVEQVRLLADAVPARNRAMVIAQAGLGLRIAELLGLRIGDVQLRTVRDRLPARARGAGPVRPEDPDVPPDHPAASSSSLTALKRST